MNNELTRISGSELEKKWKDMNAALERLGQAEVKGRVREARAGARLLFGIDLTASREKSLREARIATAAMFNVLKSIAADRLAMKLVYYRGREVKASGWERNADVLRRAMEKLSCKAGCTQIGGVLRMALREKEKLSALVLVLDHCEEDGCELDDLASSLGEKRSPIFVFHDCADGNSLALEAQPIFEGMAEVSGGAYCPLGADSGDALFELLSMVAAFSAAGSEAVKRVPQFTPEARQLQARLLLPAGK
jgi:hypothetical protein